MLLPLHNKITEIYPVVGVYSSKLLVPYLLREKFSWLVATLSKISPQRWKCASRLCSKDTTAGLFCWLVASALALAGTTSTVDCSSALGSLSDECFVAGLAVSRSSGVDVHFIGVINTSVVFKLISRSSRNCDSGGVGFEPFSVDAYEEFGCVSIERKTSLRLT